MADSAGQQFREGDLIGERHRVVRRLGRGGMAEIYEAENTLTGRRVAVKVLHVYVALDAGSMGRFRQEAQTASKLAHPNIIDVFDMGADPATGTVFIVEELLVGETLAERLKREGRIEPIAALDVLLPVMGALAAAHREGVVHRDVKPENIFLARTPDGEVLPKLIDFGLAKALEVVDGRTHPGQILGTPRFMSPEQFKGIPDIDGRTDVWAMGVVLYEALSGVAPFDGPTAHAVLFKVMSERPAGLETLASATPVSLANVVLGALTVDRAKRYPNIEALVDALLGCEAMAKDAEALRARHRRALGGGGHAPSGLPEAVVAAGGDAPVRGTSLGSNTSQGWTVDKGDLESAKTLPSIPEPARESGSVAPPVPSQPPARPIRRARWRSFVAALVVLCAGAFVARWRVARWRASQASPLSAPGSTLACPQWSTVGGDSDVWQGAAAAALACERAALMLGGVPGRTLVPAELLRLPRQPTADFPRDPYGGDARLRAIASAREGASAWLDGELSRDATAGFRVDLVARRRDGSELGRSAGRGMALYQAVRQAVDRLGASGVIPMEGRLDPTVARWFNARTSRAALAVMDADLVQVGVTRAEECRRLIGLRAELFLALPLEFACSGVDALRYPDRPALDRSSNAALSWTAFAAESMTPDQARGIADEAARARSREESTLGRAMLATAESNARYRAGEAERGHSLGLTAVSLRPRSPWAWNVLGPDYLSAATREQVLRANAAWIPYSTVTWVIRGEQTADAAERVRVLRRAWDQLPGASVSGGPLADALVIHGAVEEARSVAAALAVGTEGAQRASEVVLLRVAAAEGRFRDARRRALAILEARRATRQMAYGSYKLLVSARELAAILGHTREQANDLIARFVDVDPSRVDALDMNMIEVALTCALASPAPSRRCFDRLAALRRAHYFNMMPGGGEAFVTGAESYARGDLTEAARAWRPLLHAPSPTIARVALVVAPTFDRVGEPDLAERADQWQLDRAREFNGATLAHVRAAVRAWRRGDHARARRLAQTVVDAWGVADETVPAVAEMRALLARPDAEDGPTEPGPTAAPTPPGSEDESRASRIASALEERRSEINACYEREARANPALSGRLEIHFSVGAAGQALNLSTHGLENSQDARRCIADIVWRIRFPPSPRGEYAVSYPFNFHP